MKKNIGIFGTTICVVAFCTVSSAYAEGLPKWEIGAGLATVTAPDYRGSDITSTRVLPIPYFVYRGDHLKAGRGGIRSNLLESDKLELTMSLTLSLPTKTKTGTRSISNGKATVGLGPALNVSLWDSADDKIKLLLRLPVRSVFTLESSPQEIGRTFSPGLDLQIKDPEGKAGWNLGISGSAIFNNRKFNSHFYTVTAAEATATTPMYTAPGGYAGLQSTFSLSKRYPAYWVGAFLRVDTVSGAVFERSPMVKKRTGVSGGIAMSWVFGESSTKVSPTKELFAEDK